MSISAINTNSREPWIDCARGIAILLVIVGHTVSGVLSGAIYSFHMPLFFIFSGITLKLSSTNDQFVRRTERSFKQLMGPFFLIYGIQTLIYLFRHLSNILQDHSFLMEYLNQRILTGVFSSGVSISVLNATILYIGVIWFFPALFISRTIFDYLHLKLTTKQLPLYCLLLSIIGMLIGQIQALPFSFDIVLAILPLFYLGSQFRFFSDKEFTHPEVIFIYLFVGIVSDRYLYWWKALPGTLTQTLSGLPALFYHRDCRHINGIRVQCDLL